MADAGYKLIQGSKFCCCCCCCCCVCVCVRACVRACVCVCVCARACVLFCFLWCLLLLLLFFVCFVVLIFLLIYAQRCYLTLNALMRKALPFLQTVASPKTNKQKTTKTTTKNGASVCVCVCLCLITHVHNFSCVCALGPACKRRYGVIMCASVRVSVHTDCLLTLSHQKSNPVQTIQPPQAHQ